MPGRNSTQVRSRSKIVAIDFHTPAPIPAPAPVLVRPTDDQIRARAYQLFVERGCNPGSPVIDWLDAEHQLFEELNSRAA